MCEYLFVCARCDDVLLCVTDVLLCVKMCCIGEDVLLCVRMGCHVLLCVKMCCYV
jgi:hypothetical protein